MGVDDARRRAGGRSVVGAFQNPSYDRLWGMIRATFEQRGVVEGHAAGIRDIPTINAFAAAGLASDHEAWTVEELWFMGSTPGYPDHFVDITDTFDRKIKALLCHASQLSDPDGIDPWIRQWNRENA